MKNIFKSELKRAIFSKEMLFAIIIGLIISIWHIVSIVPDNMIGADFESLFPLAYPLHVFNMWIGNSYGIQPYLYYFLLPIIVVIPFGLSYYSDMKSGYINHICLRVSKKKYLMSKYCATFISGGIAFIIPLLINLMATAVLFPSILPQASDEMGNTLTTSYILYKLYFNQPYLYIFIYFIIDFIAGGIVASIALAVSKFVSHIYMVVAYPLVIYIFFYSLLDMIGQSEYGLVYILNPGHGMKGIIPLICIAIFGILTAMIYYLPAKKWR